MVKYIMQKLGVSKCKVQYHLRFLSAVYLLKVRIYVLHMEIHFKQSYGHGPLCEIYI